MMSNDDWKWKIEYTLLIIHAVSWIIKISKKDFVWGY